MWNKKETVTTKLGDVDVTLESGQLAFQASGAATARMGDTVVLATVVRSADVGDANYFPLQVEYREKYYATGKIGGGRFMKREGKPSDEAVLTARLVDRAIRPLFNERTRNEIQIILSVLSFDGVNDPDVVAMLAASTALTVSDIPFDGPVVGIRVGLDGDQVVLNKGRSEIGKFSDLDFVVAGTAEHVVMLEAGANQVPEEKILEAIELAQQQFAPLCKAQSDLAKKIGREKTASILLPEDEDVKAKVGELLAPMYEDIFSSKKKLERSAKEKEAVTTIKEKLLAEMPEEKRAAIESLVAMYAEEHIYAQARKMLIENDRRIDGRKLDEIRELNIEVGVLPRTHGTGLFQRGETQALSVCTLGSSGDKQMIDGMEEGIVASEKRYMHHYNFMPFCVGEAGRVGAPSRREVGHGALAERALEPVLPAEAEFPYAIRVVTEILTANGSTSMASTCGSTLALMDAGVPIKAPVAGMAIGLVTDNGDVSKYKILTDIQGEEDHFGDMDFKLTGTRNGVTAIQMDIKVKGLTMDILREAVEAGKIARLKVLDAIEKVIKEPRSEVSPNAPRIETITIDKEKIGLIIGPGGKTIRAITAETEADIDINDDGQVFITAFDKDKMVKAVEMIKDLVWEPQVGDVLHGKVVRMFDFGCIVEFRPNKDGFLHISELADFRVENINDYIKEGDEMDVVVTEVGADGKVSLSKKLADAKLGKPGLKPKGGDSASGGHGGDRAGSDRGHGGHSRGGFRDRSDRGRDRGGFKGRDRH